MPDLSMYEPDPPVICPPGQHSVTYHRADDSYDETCNKCGLFLPDADQELAWHWDQILNDNPPALTEEY